MNMLTLMNIVIAYAGICAVAITCAVIRYLLVKTTEKNTRNRYAAYSNSVMLITELVDDILERLRVPVIEEMKNTVDNQITEADIQKVISITLPQVYNTLNHRTRTDVLRSADNVEDVIEIKIRAALSVIVNGRRSMY